MANRLAALKKLRRCIKENEREICEALHSDLGKSAYESFMCEIGLVLSEISWMIRVLCESSVKPRFVAALKKEIERQFGGEPLKNRNYGKIVSKAHFDRLANLLEREKIVAGGECDAENCRIAPTVMDDVTADDAIMQEEIFSPMLPVLAFDDFDALVDGLKRREKPLALYIFSSRKDRIGKVVREVSYGGGCINDVVIHLATSEMRFGGVGASGMGVYHGETGFNCIFPHEVDS